MRASLHTEDAILLFPGNTKGVALIFWKHSHTAQLPLEHLVDGVPGQVESVKLFLGRRAQQSWEIKTEGLGARI